MYFLDEEIRLLERIGFPQERCINYLNPDEAHEEMRAVWQNRKLKPKFLSNYIKLTMHH